MPSLDQEAIHPRCTGKSDGGKGKGKSGKGEQPIELPTRNLVCGRALWSITGEGPEHFSCLKVQSKQPQWLLALKSGYHNAAGDGGKGKGAGKGKDKGKGKSKGKGKGAKGKGAKGGAKVVVEPHRHPGVFVARGKEDVLVTRNLVPGDAVYGEKRISVEEGEGETKTKIEYRVWNPFRSK